jgi:hypothetical protein
MRSHYVAPGPLGGVLSSAFPARRSAVAGDRGFESRSLQRRVRCEHDFRLPSRSGPIHSFEFQPVAPSARRRRASACCVAVNFGGRPRRCLRFCARLRPSAVRVRIRSRSTTANPPNTAIINRLVLVPVSAHGSASERNCAFYACSRRRSLRSAGQKPPMPTASVDYRGAI